MSYESRLPDSHWRTRTWLKVSFDPMYVVRSDAAVEGKVGLVSGGGSGHES